MDLQNFLLALGARVRGAGSSVITVEGGVPLHGGSYTVMGDRIVACTYLAAAAAAGGHVEVTGVDWRNLSTVTAVLTEAGCTVRSQPGRITLACTKPLKGVRPIRTAPYPGFPTDAQAPLMAALCKGSGCTVFVENMFDKMCIRDRSNGGWMRKNPTPCRNSSPKTTSAASILSLIHI